jgi:hypothetical protein
MAVSNEIWTRALLTAWMVGRASWKKPTLFLFGFHLFLKVILLNYGIDYKGQKEVQQ